MITNWATALTLLWSFTASAAGLFGLSGHNQEIGYAYAKLIKYDGGQNPDILYYMYDETGAPADLFAPNTLVGKLRREWSARRMDPPTVVAIAVDPQAPDLKKLLHDVMFDIQSTLPAVPRRQMLLGVSLGAVNALNMAIRAPRRFHKIALLEFTAREKAMSRTLKIKVRRKLNLSGADFFFDEGGSGTLLTTLHKTNCALTLGVSTKKKSGVARLARFFL